MGASQPSAIETSTRATGGRSTLEAGVERPVSLGGRHPDGHQGHIDTPFTPAARPIVGTGVAPTAGLTSALYRIAVGRWSKAVLIVLAAIGGLAVIAVLGLVVLWWLSYSGVRAGQSQLDAYGVPVPRAVYVAETNDRGSDLCYTANCTIVARTYRLPAHPRLSVVEAELIRRMQQLGYLPGASRCAADDDENHIPPRWQFSCSVAGQRGTKHIGALVHLDGVNPDYVPFLGPPPYSRYGGVDSHDVPRPPGDPVTVSLELDASG